MWRSAAGPGGRGQAGRRRRQHFECTGWWRRGGQQRRRRRHDAAGRLAGGGRDAGHGRMRVPTATCLPAVPAHTARVGGWRTYRLSIVHDARRSPALTELEVPEDEDGEEAGADLQPYREVALVVAGANGQGCRNESCAKVRGQQAGGRRRRRWNTSVGIQPCIVASKYSGTKQAGRRRPACGELDFATRVPRAGLIKA